VRIEKRRTLVVSIVCTCLALCLCLILVSLKTPSLPSQSGSVRDSANCLDDRFPPSADVSGLDRPASCIGMQQVTGLFGKPQQINRTMTAHSEGDQYVYGGHYLYFEDFGLSVIEPRRPGGSRPGPALNIRCSYRWAERCDMFMVR